MIETLDGNIVCLNIQVYMKLHVDKDQMFVYDAVYLLSNRKWNLELRISIFALADVMHIRYWIIVMIPMHIMKIKVHPFNDECF